MIEYLELSHETKLQLFTEKMSKLSQIRLISRIHEFCRSCGLPTHAACVHTTGRTAGNPAWVRSKTVANGALVAGGDGAVLKTMKSTANYRNPRHFAHITLCDCHGRRTATRNASPCGVDEY